MLVDFVSAKNAIIRLSTLRNADCLVVVDKHGVAEIGTHNELLEKKGIYYGLVTAQLKMAEGQ